MKARSRGEIIIFDLGNYPYTSKHLLKFGLNPSKYATNTFSAGMTGCLGYEEISISLVFQIPCEDRRLNPQTFGEKAFRGFKHLFTRYLEDFGRLG